MNMLFVGYQVTDDGVVLHFTWTNRNTPGTTEFYVLLTDGELSAITTQAQLRTLVMNKLNRKLRATGIATKLDPFIGQTITI